MLYSASDVVVVDLVEELADLRHLLLRFDHVLDLLAQALGGPAQMHFQNLTDVHTRRHAQRVQQMSTGRPSAMYGMSSTGTTFDTTPLLP